MRTRAGQIRPLFLAACTGVLGLALVGVLIVAFWGDSTNGLIFGMGVLLAGALGGFGLALLIGLGRPERRPVGRPPRGALVFAFLGATVGAFSSAKWCWPFSGRPCPPRRITHCFGSFPWLSVWRSGRWSAFSPGVSALYGDVRLGGRPGVAAVPATGRYEALLEEAAMTADLQRRLESTILSGAPWRTSFFYCERTRRRESRRARYTPSWSRCGTRPRTKRPTTASLKSPISSPASARRT